MMNVLGTTYILGTGSRHLNPCFGEEGAGAEHEYNVEHGVDGILSHVPQCLGRRQIVTQPPDRVRAGRAATSNISPCAQKIHEEVATEFGSEHL